MKVDDELIVVSDDDPQRCQGQHPKRGQCTYKSTVDTDFCPVHASGLATKRNKEGLRNYHLTVWQARLAKHSSSNHIKDLRDEIGILRMVLEEKLEQCTNSIDLIYQAGPISDLVMKINNIVSSCHKLETSMGQMLDKQILIQFAQRVIDIISSNLKGQEDLIVKIATEIDASINDI